MDAEKILCYRAVLRMARAKLLLLCKNFIKDFLTLQTKQRKIFLM